MGPVGDCSYGMETHDRGIMDDSDEGQLLSYFLSPSGAGASPPTTGAGTALGVMNDLSFETSNNNILHGNGQSSTPVLAPPRGFPPPLHGASFQEAVQKFVSGESVDGRYLPDRHIPTSGEPSELTPIPPMPSKSVSLPSIAKSTNSFDAKTSGGLWSRSVPSIPAIQFYTTSPSISNHDIAGISAGAAAAAAITSNNNVCVDPKSFSSMPGFSSRTREHQNQHSALHRVSPSLSSSSSAPSFGPNNTMPNFFIGNIEQDSRNDYSESKNNYLRQNIMNQQQLQQHHIYSQRYSSQNLVDLQPKSEPHQQPLRVMPVIPREQQNNAMDAKHQTPLWLSDGNSCSKKHQLIRDMQENNARAQEQLAQNQKLINQNTLVSQNKDKLQHLSSLNQSNQTHLQQQNRNEYQHLEWLRQMNSLAMRAHQSSSALGGNQLVQPLPPGEKTSHPIDLTNPATSAVKDYRQQVTFNISQSSNSIPENPDVGSTRHSAQNLLDSCPDATVHQPTETNVVVPSMTNSCGENIGGSHPNESRERRTRRLARNRESARQSRRRKKDLLLTLGDKVNKLHNEIEQERMSQINAMEKEFIAHKKETIREMSEVLSNFDEMDPSNEDKALQILLRQVLQSLGPNSLSRQHVAAFQNSQIRYHVFPTFNRFLLWLSMQPDSLFTAAKDERSKVSTNSRLSSKQIGEELTSAINPSDASFVEGKPLGPRISSTKTNDFLRFWPMFCYEMSLSVDQEDRFLNYYRAAKQQIDHEQNSRQIASVLSLTSDTKKGIAINSQQAACSADKCLYSILNPQQSARFLKWFEINKDRCQVIVGKRTSKKQIVRESSLSDLASEIEKTLKVRR